jgi:glucose-6-phosphate 1-dehydrogenase
MQTVFLVFGLTGDLMRYKGIPALFALYRAGSLPSSFRILGFSRKQWDNAAIRMLITTSLGDRASETEIASFAELFEIVQGEGTEPASYSALKAAAGTPEQLITYLCVSPELYAPIVENLGSSGMLAPNTRLLIEKPFGRNLESAAALQALLLNYVPEEHIFRIDHYLAKDGVALLGQENPANIAEIDVFLLETAGVEKRGAVYDAVGCLRDVGQNHMLEMLATAAGGNREEVLRGLHTLTPEECATQTARGQYEGYRLIEGVSPNSQTETYFKINTTLAAGAHQIAVLLEAGKRLATQRKEVVIRRTDGSSVTVSLDSKNNEYETLFSEAFAGNRNRFVSMSEVEVLWGFLSPIQAQWDKGAVPLVPYAPDTDTICETSR